MTISIAKLTNISDEEIFVGNVTAMPGESLTYWDVGDQSEADEILTEIRLAESEMFSLIEDGYAEMIEDGATISFEDSVQHFNAIKVNSDRNKNVGAIIANGITLNENKDSRGNMMFVNESRTGSDLEIVTHNFSDRTTWYTESVRVYGEDVTEFTSSEDGYTCELNHKFVIDLDHGKVHNEDKICSESIAAGSHGYRPIVFVDGYVQCELTPWEASVDNCNYKINYRDGYITFFEDVSESLVKVDYSYENGSTWILQPNPGKGVDIEKSEAQFSKDLIFNDAIDFQIWAYNPYDLPNRVPVQTASYKSIHNFVDEAAGSYPLIDPVGGAAPLGLVSPIIGFPFNYNTIRSLNSSQGVQLRISTRNDREFGGERATATFYCTIRDE